MRRHPPTPDHRWEGGCFACGADWYEIAICVAYPSGRRPAECWDASPTKCELRNCRRRHPSQLALLTESEIDSVISIRAVEGLGGPEL